MTLPVFAHDAFEKQAGFVIHRRAHARRSSAETCAVSKVLLCQALKPQPLRAKTIEQRTRAGILQQTLHLRLQNRPAREAFRCPPAPSAHHRAWWPITDKTDAKRVDSRRGERSRCVGLRFSGRSNKQKLRRNQDRLEHQAQRRRIGEFVLPSQVEHLEQHIQFRLRRTAGDRLCVPATGRPRAPPRERRRPGCRWFAEQPLLHFGRRRACRRQQSGPSTLSAIARYCSSCSGESEFRYPSPLTSSGNSLAIAGSTPNRSCSVLPYSVLVSRRMTNSPGSFGLRYFTFDSQSTNICRSASVGCLSRHRAACHAPSPWQRLFSTVG